MTRPRIPVWLSVTALFAVVLAATASLRFLRGDNAGAQGPAYLIESIEMPEGLTAEVGGLDFLDDGRLVACFHRGEVMIYDPKTRDWKLFAQGLHDPLGLLVERDNEILVMQQPELTRIKDTDGDGVADLYESVTHDFGISGNYHEFNYGPVKDSAGNLFIALNTGSSGDGIRPEVRGELRTIGRDGENGNRQMFSVVPYRGWVLKVSPHGEVIPYASGFRSPNGIGLDTCGNLFVADNQGDWVATSAFYHVEEGKFYGHPASLVWRRGWKDVNPFYLPVAELNRMRSRAAVLFPQGIIANSPSQPVFDATGGKFGPFGGQWLIGEMNRERIVRVMLESIGGALQGACIPFIDGQGLRQGNNRLAFAPDGSLWVGQTDHGWAGAEGIQRIVFTGKTPMDIYEMKLTARGFDLTFTLPVDATAARDPRHYSFRHYYYDYYKKEPGEPVDTSIQLDVQPVEVTDVEVSRDGRTVSLSLAKLRPGYIYELKLAGIKSEKGRPLANNLICYTLNRLIDKDTPPSSLK